MSDEKPFDLNDQFAIAALQSIIAGNPSQRYKLCNYYITGEAANIEEYEIETMERIARVAYHMARAMRKARLGAFE